MGAKKFRVYEHKEFLSSLEPRGAVPSMSEYTNIISSIHSTTSVSKRTDIRMTTLEMMRKNYKDDADIIN